VVAELRSLYERKQIDWLVLSQHNVGKAGAWNWIFAAMPNDLICYADSDVLFRPGWLEASLQVIEAFPQAGMVSAQPNFYDVMKGEGKAYLQLHAGGGYTFSNYRPAREVVDEFCLGIGATEEIAAPFYQNPLPAVTHQETGIQAVIGASHMQFLIPRQVARQIVPLPATMGLHRAETMALDYKIDELGYLHLSTREPYVFHMGNTLSERLLQKVEQATGSLTARPELDQKLAAPGNIWRRLGTRLVQHPRLNRQFVRLYHFLFQSLHTDQS
jgi:hypothetical protein